MSITNPVENARNVRAEIDEPTHKALQIRQNRIQEATGKRPLMIDVVSIALSEWAAKQTQDS